MIPYTSLSTGFVSGGGLRYIPGATVTVYAAGTTTKAAIYAADELTPINNPGTADANGSFVFYAPESLYDIVSQSGSNYSKTTVSLCQSNTSLQANLPLTVGSLHYGKVVKLNQASGGVVTLPSNAPRDTVIGFLVEGVGVPTFVTASGGPPKNRSGHTGAAGQYGYVTVMVAENPDGQSADWYLFGDTA